jgi:hypothetical protein
MQGLTGTAYPPPAAIRELSFAALAMHEAIGGEYARINAQYRRYNLPLPAMEHARLWRRFADWRAQIGAIAASFPAPEVVGYADALIAWLNGAHTSLVAVLPRPGGYMQPAQPRKAPVVQQPARPLGATPNVAPALPVARPVVDDAMMQLWAERQLEQTATAQTARELRGRQAEHSRRMLSMRSAAADRIAAMRARSLRS